MVLLGEVYAAGEEPIVAADSRALMRALRVAGKVEPYFVEQVADFPAAVHRVARAGDVVICMGAGTIGAIPAKLAAGEGREENQEASNIAGKGDAA